jgi:ribosomal protein S18 acetylase RimI-like enzyme
MKDQECEAVDEIARGEQATDMEDTPRFPLVASTGHRAPLLFEEGVTLGRKVIVQQLDLASEAVKDAILTDVQAAANEGTVARRTRYKGKHATKWLEMIYPAVFRPVFLGAFFPDGTLLGWVSMLRTEPTNDHALLGAVIRPPYRNHGLGSALVLHAWRHAAEIYGDPSIMGIAFETQETNAAVMAIAKKHHLAFVSERVDESGATPVRYAYFKASPSNM